MSARIKWEPLADLIANSPRILISTHVRADGDALGSEVALAQGLRHLGHEVAVVNPDAVPSTLDFCDPLKEIYSIGNNFSGSDFSYYDLILVVDTSAERQLPGVVDAIRASGVPCAVIDHHAVSDNLSEHSYTDASSPATGCLIMELLRFLGIPLNLRIPAAKNTSTGAAEVPYESLSVAEALFLAISTDTGWFRFPSVTQETYIQAGELVRNGVSPSKLYSLVYERHEVSRLKLLGLVASHADLLCQGRLAYSYVSAEDFRAIKSDYSQTTDLVNQLLGTRGVYAAVIFYEQADAVRISFRSRSSLDVAQIARKFGGGGHKQASGASLTHLTLKESMERVLSEMTISLEENSVTKSQEENSECNRNT